MGRLASGDVMIISYARGSNLLYLNAWATCGLGDGQADIGPNNLDFEMNFGIMALICMRDHARESCLEIWYSALLQNFVFSDIFLIWGVDHEWCRLVIGRYFVSSYREFIRTKEIKGPHNVKSKYVYYEVDLTSSSLWWLASYDDVIKWGHFQRYWPFVWGIHRSPANSPHHKGQGTLICAWTNGWVNSWDAGDLRHAHIITSL